MGNTNLSKALGLKYISDFSEICAPILRTGLMSYLTYSRIYSDRSRIYLCVKPDWFIRYHTEFYEKGVSHKLASCNQKRVYCRKDFLDQEIFRIGREDFHLPDPICVMNQLEDGQEIFLFGHGSKTNADSLDLQYYELIQNFIFYFREKSKKLIRLIQKDRELLPLANKLPGETFLVTTNNEFEEVSHYLREETEDYFFKGNGINLFLTKKEIECIRGLSKGEIIKQIAYRLGLSARTVESHLNKAKAKVGAMKNCELVYKLSALGII